MLPGYNVKHAYMFLLLYYKYSRGTWFRMVVQLQKGGFQAVVQHAACGLAGKEFQNKHPRGKPSRLTLDFLVPRKRGICSVTLF